jgi:hypothetical protein
MMDHRGNPVTTGLVEAEGLMGVEMGRRWIRGLRHVAFVKIC